MEYNGKFKIENTDTGEKCFLFSFRSILTLLSQALTGSSCYLILFTKYFLACSFYHKIVLYLKKRVFKYTLKALLMI